MGANVKFQLDFFNATDVDTKKCRRYWYIKLAKKVYLESLKAEADKLDIDKLEKVPNGLNSLKSKVDKLDVDKLVPVPVDFSKLKMLLKRLNMIKWLKTITLLRLLMLVI